MKLQWVLSPKYGFTEKQGNGTPTQASGQEVQLYSRVGQCFELVARYRDKRN